MQKSKELIGKEGRKTYISNCIGSRMENENVSLEFLAKVVCEFPELAETALLSALRVASKKQISLCLPANAK